MLLSELAERVLSCERGDLSGRCVVCGRHTTQGFAPQFGDKFTSWQHLQFFQDSVLCPPCYTFLTQPEWRRHHWLMTSDEVRFLQRSELREVVLSPPRPPFAFYTTQTFKKHGWIVLQMHVNLSTTHLRWAWDEQVFIEPLYNVVSMLGFVENLRSRGWKVQELLQRWTVKHIAEATELYHVWKQFKRSPAWEWIVWISRAGDAQDDEPAKQQFQEGLFAFANT